MIKVLSVDWDYFINEINTTQRTCMPDLPNEKYPMGLMNTIWVTCYSTSIINKVDFNKIGIDMKNLKILKRIMDNQSNKTQFFVTSSHARIYYAIERKARMMNDYEISIVNLDEHDDLSNYNNYIDCGNWGSNLISDFNVSEFIWYYNNNTAEESIEKAYKYNVTALSPEHDLTELLGEKYDLVFICKSEPWTFPHHDLLFTETFKKYDYYDTDVYINRNKLIQPAIKDYLKIVKPYVNNFGGISNE